MSQKKKHRMPFEKCQENIIFSALLQFADITYILTPSPAQRSGSETGCANGPLAALSGMPRTPPDLLWLLNGAVGISLMNSIVPAV